MLHGSAGSVLQSASMLAQHLCTGEMLPVGAIIKSPEHVSGHVQSITTTGSVLTLFHGSTPEGHDLDIEELGELYTRESLQSVM